MFCDYGAVGGRSPNVAVAFEDFFGGYVGAVVEKGGVVEDGLEIFRDLKAGLAMVAEVVRLYVHTSDISSLNSIKVLTTSIAKKLFSSWPTTAVLSLRMLGVMTVARL